MYNYKYNISCIIIQGLLKKEVIGVSLLRLKIDILKSIMNKKLEQNDYVVNNDILNISQILDKLILAYEKEESKYYINKYI